ncbi:ComEA family DNA-binding protein [Microbacterium hominis]|uniref:ComEA family DNA-binding protein n=1 Tax=Microbacterium hominis TaxID=162426 RepID=A0A7D4TQD8_9MICO|nr:ComEA family DNA-binding protein [Microbacterium hominis]
MGAAVVLALGALAITIGIGVIRGATAPVEEVVLATPATTAAAAPEAPAAMYVHVSGAVREPGLYVVAAGARVVDAIAAAGGFADDADEAAVNLARAVADGEQLHVPVPGEIVRTAPDGAGGGAAGSGLVNLNTADAAALDTLPRIGPALAARIIAWRDQNGPFASVDDLLAVPGIGEQIVEGLRPAVTV